MALLVLVTLSAAFGYFYFDQKFTPEKNYLIVKNQSGKIPISWQGIDKNAMLLPIHFEGDNSIYYLQFDTGSPYTVLYKNSAKKIKQITATNKTGKAIFFVGLTKVSSKKFKIIDNGETFNPRDSIKVIGTLGSDILENRKTFINFKKNFVTFNLSRQPLGVENHSFDFSFKKRKILIRGILNGNEENFLYDSGTSAYELLTNKEIWNTLKTAHSKIKIEKANSWQNILTTHSAESNCQISFNQKSLPIQTVTYVDGFSKTQYLLMKFSGMTGMLGNKFFLRSSIYLDCSAKKIMIE